MRTNFFAKGCIQILQVWACKLHLNIWQMLFQIYPLGLENQTYDLLPGVARLSLHEIKMDIFNGILQTVFIINDLSVSL